MADSLDALSKFASVNIHVSETISVIERAFNLYGLDGICLSFNGGKDCTALLHLVHNVAIRLFHSQNDLKLKAFYVRLPNHFEEEWNFISKCLTLYDLQLIQYSDPSIKIALYKLKKEYPYIQAIFIGTRSVDLAQTLDTFQQTDLGWPEFIRVNPILNWTYRQVWDFLRGLNIPYCDLYNEGYSSLGTVKNTKKNSSLLRYDEQGNAYYLPAWYLDQPEEERQSRASNI